MRKQHELQEVYTAISDKLRFDEISKGMEVCLRSTLAGITKVVRHKDGTYTHKVHPDATKEELAKNMVNSRAFNEHMMAMAIDGNDIGTFEYCAQREQAIAYVESLLAE